MSPQEIESVTVRSVRRALMASLLSIVAASLMLLGATYAWFTMSTTSGVVTLTADHFDVTVGKNAFEAGTHTVTLTRTGNGTSPGYCRFTLTLSGTYTETQTVTYSDGTQEPPTDKTVELSATKNCYANFSGNQNETITFTLNLTNATASITGVTASWGSNNGSGDSSAVVLRGPRLLTAAPRPETVEITDGFSIDFGMEDQSIDVPASEAQEAEKLAAEEAAKAEQLAIEAAANAAQQPEAQTTTDDTQTTMNGDNNDGGNDNDNADPGTGNDGNGSGAGGSGSAGSGGGSGAGGGESESGAGGSGAGKSESGSGESGGTDNGDSGSGTDSGSSGDSGSGTDSGSGDSGTDSGAGE